MTFKEDFTTFWLLKGTLPESIFVLEEVEIYQNTYIDENENNVHCGQYTQ